MRTRARAVGADSLTSSWQARRAQAQSCVRFYSVWSRGPQHQRRSPLLGCDRYSQQARDAFEKVTCRSGAIHPSARLRVGVHIALASMYCIRGRTLLMFHIVAKDRSRARRWIRPLQQHMVYDVRQHAMCIGGRAPRALVRHLGVRQPWRARVARIQLPHTSISGPCIPTWHAWYRIAFRVGSLRGLGSSEASPSTLLRLGLPPAWAESGPGLHRMAAPCCCAPPPAAFARTLSAVGARRRGGGGGAYKSVYALNFTVPLQTSARFLFMS